MDAAEVVALRQRGQHGQRHQRHDVDAHQIEQAEHPGLGNADRPVHRVGFLDRQAIVERFVDGDGDPVATDAVGDEARRVLRPHHALAEPHIAQLGQRLHRVRPRIRSLHDLQQAHVARRIEEMGDAEVAPERVDCSSTKARSGMVDVLEDTIEPGLRTGSMPIVQRALGAEVFDDRFDNPVAFAKSVAGRRRNCPA